MRVLFHDTAEAAAGFDRNYGYAVWASIIPIEHPVDYDYAVGFGMTEAEAEAAAFSQINGGEYYGNAHNGQSDFDLVLFRDSTQYPYMAPHTPQKKSSSNSGLYIGLGVVAVGALYLFTKPEGVEAESFSPDLGYSATETGYAYNVGGRWDYRNDNLHLHFAALQTNDDFRYESGAQYHGEFWTAKFAESVNGKTADYDFALSADYKSGIWQLSPTYRLQSRFTDIGEWESDNSLNFEAVLEYNWWTIRPSAGFAWQSADEFGENAEFGISAVRRF